MISLKSLQNKEKKKKFGGVLKLSNFIPTNQYLLNIYIITSKNSLFKFAFKKKFSIVLKKL